LGFVMVPAESADSGLFLARFAAFVAVIVGVFVLMGWWLDLEPLTNIVSSWPRMARLTASTFILSGVALWLASSGTPRATLLFAGLVALIGDRKSTRLNSSHG